MVFAAEFNGDGAEDEAGDEKGKEVVEAREESGVGVGEAGEEAAHEDDDPDFVAVPDGADGVEEDAALVVVAGKEVEGADAEVEAVEDAVGDGGEAEDDVPEDFGVDHGGAR